MTQEDKELLIQDLCARLPYGVKIKTSYNKMDEPIELRFVNPRNESFAIGSSFTLISGLDFDTYECKPYLFPMSSMTKEQYDEFTDMGYSVTERWWSMANYHQIEWLNKNHFDYRGLIKKGLAIDATNKNIY